MPIIYLQREMTGEIILVILSLAGMISAQIDCPPRGMNDSCIHLHIVTRFVQLLLQRYIHHAWFAIGMLKKFMTRTLIDKLINPL